jgi:hypothetical protein
MNNKTFTLFDPALVVPALREAFRKLSPAVQWRNPVMFVVYVGSILTTLLAIQALGGEGEAPTGFIVAITVWLWFTVLFANFAEALAEGRSKAQAASLRGLKKETWAKKLQAPQYGAPWQLVQGSDLRKGDLVVVEAGDIGQSVIPADGEVIEGVALGGRIGHHRRIRPRDPGVGRRLLGGDRWHPRAVGLDRRACHRQPRRDFRGPHDRHGGERQAPEDTQRNRPDHSAGGTDHRFPGRHRHAAAFLPVQRGRIRCRQAGRHHGAGGPCWCA